MQVLGIDVGSSSVKAGILKNRKLVGKTARASFATQYDGDRAEVSAESIAHAVAKAIAELGPRAKKVDVLALSVMGPSWVAMDRAGRAITPVITHQDRRSVEISRDLVKRIGKQKLLKTTGNLPFPGGISCTTWAWYLKHEPRMMKQADLVGHLQTYLHRQFNNARVIDPSQASFTGLFDTLTQKGWNEGLCDEMKIAEHQLPQLVDSDGVAGMVTRTAGEKFGLTHGTPMLMGCMDTSAALLLAGAKNGNLLNVVGSTDVLAICTEAPKPHERLLTRAFGIGKKWVAVSTLAASGSALSWGKDQLYADTSIEKFFDLVEEVGRDGHNKRRDATDVTFDPHLAGDRASIDQRRASFTGLTLSSTRRQMLAAIIESLVKASANRLKLLREMYPKIGREVVVTGGVRGALDDFMHRDWPGKWRFRHEDEATLRGLAVLADR